MILSIICIIYKNLIFFSHANKKAKSMLSMLNASTVESDEERDNLKYYPSDADEEREVTCTGLLEKVTKMQRELPSLRSTRAS